MKAASLGLKIVKKERGGVKLKFLTLDQCDVAYETLRGSAHAERKRQTLRELCSAHLAINMKIGRGKPFWRARKCSGEGFTNEKELWYPPAELTKVGRLNDKGQPCLYLSTRKETAFKEVNAVEGDYVQLAGFRIKPTSSLRALAIGEWEHIERTGHFRIFGNDPDGAVSRVLNNFPYEYGRSLVYLDSILGSILADPDARRNDYELTRMTGMVTQEKVPSANSLFYPSVQLTLGMNLSVQSSAADDHLHGACAAVVKIIKEHRFGMYDFEICRVATGVDGAGNYKWKTPSHPRELYLYRLTKEELDKSGNTLLDLFSDHNDVSGVER